MTGTESTLEASDLRVVAVASYGALPR